MSERFPGGIISKTAPVPTGPYENGTAPGVWTLEQQAEFVKQGIWPIAGLTPNYIENVFQTWLYTGNGSTQTITNGVDLAGKGGLVWAKARSRSGDNHEWRDTVRGGNSRIFSNNTNAASSTPNPYTYNADGYTIGGDGGNTNENNITYASWTFREQEKFFDVVTYTGTGTTMTVPHNLGAVPGCMIVKGLNAASAWDVYHQSLGPTQVMRLSTTDAASGQPQWDNTAPTSTVFTVKGGETTNVNGRTYVAYLFAHNAGGFGLSGTDNVISCGSFTTDGSGNATVNLGYEPQWVMIKASSTTGSWIMNDNMRGMPATLNAAQLFANLSNAENTNVNGTRTNATGFNAVSVGADTTFIYIAIRRGPMRTPTTGTSVFAPVLAASASETVNTVGFTPDMQLIKQTGNAVGTNAVDRLRGVSTRRQFNAGQFLLTSSTAAESSNFSTQYWDNTGFSTPFDTSGISTIYWTFRRAPGFMDVVCYTGTGTSSRALNHNLGVSPELVIFRKRSTAANWIVENSNLGSAFYGTLNSTEIFYNNAVAQELWPANNLSSSTITVGAGLNDSGVTLVAYLFASCLGVSKVGSFTGTGATQVINCGFTGGARFVLIKATSTTGNWLVWDSVRGIVAGNDPYLVLNSTAAEVTNTDWVDTASTGFELSNAGGNLANSNGVSYIFLAIA